MVLANEMKYPHMREELIGHLKALSNRGYQESVWVRGEAQPGVIHDELDYVVHFIYDDTCLGEDPDAAIGWFLLGEAEAKSIRDLVRLLDSLFAKYGLNLTDEEYIGKSEWGDVVAAAEISKNLLLSSE